MENRVPVILDLRDTKPLFLAWASTMQMLSSASKSFFIAADKAAVSIRSLYKQNNNKLIISAKILSLTAMGSQPHRH